MVKTPVGRIRRSGLKRAAAFPSHKSKSRLKRRMQPKLAALQAWYGL